MPVRALLAFVAILWPWPLVVAFFFAVAEDYLSFSGGEKDIVLALPLALMALFYSVSCLVLWWRGRPLGRCVWQSLLIAFGLVLFIWLGLLAWQFIRFDLLGMR